MMRWIQWMFMIECLVALGCGTGLLLQGKGGGLAGAGMMGLGVIAGMAFVQALRPPPRL